MITLSSNNDLYARNSSLIKFILVLFLLPGAPDDFVELLSGEVEAAAHEGAHGHEGGPLGRTKNLEHRVHPDTGHVVDEVHPAQVGQAQQGSDGEPLGPREVCIKFTNQDKTQNLPCGEDLFDKKHLSELEGNNCCVHTVVEDGGKVLVQLHGEDELAVNVVQGPEYDADKHPDGKGSRGEDQVTRGAERLDEVGQDRDDEEDELEEHVEEGQVLPHASELVSAPA